MHRLQAGEIDTSGWTTAKSTEGNYSVRLPCKFNDYTVNIDLKKEPEANSRRIFVVGCQRADSVRFFVARPEYIDSVSGAQKAFDAFLLGGSVPGSRVESGTYRNLRYATSFVSEGGKCAWFRMYRLKSDTILMIVEPIGVACSDLSKVAKNFFDSLEVDQ